MEKSVGICLLFNTLLRFSLCYNLPAVNPLVDYELSSPGEGLATVRAGIWFLSWVRLRSSNWRGKRQLTGVNSGVEAQPLLHSKPLTTVLQGINETKRPQLSLPSLNQENLLPGICMASLLCAPSCGRQGSQPGTKCLTKPNHPIQEILNTNNKKKRKQTWTNFFPQMPHW